jgi:glycoside/pentoside/hexuronide:cation symporter, GPH family
MKDSIATLPVEKLPLSTKVIYGLGDWGNTTTSTIFLFFFSFFLTDIARLSPAYAAPVLLIGGIWDAINDPLVGVLMDRVHTRWGRRRPFFILGAIPFALTFMLLWWVPPIHTQLGLAIFYGLAYILFDPAWTAVCVPYSALTPELSEDYDERTQLSGFRMAVSLAGGLLAAVSVPMIVDAVSGAAGGESLVGQRSGYFAVAVIFGSLAAVPYLLLFFKIRERKTEARQENLGIMASFKHTFNNRPFRYAAGIYLFAWSTVGLVGSLMVYFVTYYLRMGDQLEIVLGVVQGAALLCIPLIVFLSGRLGKQRAFVLGALSWSAVMVALSMIGRDQHVLAYVLAILAGFGIAAAHVIPWSIIPDVIEVDELATGQRREGAFYGFMVFLQKTGTAVVLALVQLILAATGYVPNVEQTPMALTAIRALFGALPALLLLVSVVLALRFPIDRQRHAELRRALAEKRALD